MKGMDLMMLGEVIPLSLMASGKRGEIDQLCGRDEEVHRLEELGLRVGVKVEVLQSGSPCIVRFDGQKLCFRDCDCLSILVREEEGTCPR